MTPAPLPQHEVVASRYELETELARGGMGIVYRALDRKSGRKIALKRTPAEGEAAELKRAMLQREFQTLVTLRHPRIIEVYDAGVDALGPYYTMELLDGADLRAKCPLPWRAVCTYLRDVTSSLALLHSRRLVHGDVGVGNVRLTSEGRAKLLDFGALSSFGKCSTVACTPPMAAPELLDGPDLDQRADLYALGATAYFALTGRHAYPASALGFLRTLWAAGKPPAPSSLVPDLPPELDELVLSLLELDRAARPARAAEVIDRLEAIAGLAPDEDERLARSYVLSARLIETGSERQRAQTEIARASQQGGALLIAGGAGLGKSAWLAELGQMARVSGAMVITLSARAPTRTFGVWRALTNQVAERSIKAAQLATGQFEALAPALLKRVDRNQDRPSARTSLEAERAALSSKLLSCLSELSHYAPLMVAIDDLHLADSESIGMYAMLADAVRGQRVLLAASVDTEQASHEGALLRGLCERWPTIELSPFDAKQTHEFVESVFGPTPATTRLSAWLQDHAAGNPRLCSELVTQLIDGEQIRYADGTWILPHELPEGATGEGIEALADAAFERRIARFSSDLVTLAECLSPHQHPLEAEICLAIASIEPALRDANLPCLLDTLVNEGVLVADHDSYAFVRPHTRELFYKRLDAAKKRNLHLRIAEELSRQAPHDARHNLEIGFHFLLAGEEKQAYFHINRNLEAAIQHADTLVDSVPSLWTLYTHLQTSGASDFDLVRIEALLTISGFYRDPTVQDRFGERVVRELHRILGLKVADKLARFVGARVALVLGLAVGFFRLLLSRSLFDVSTLRSGMLAFAGACGAMAGVAVFRNDQRVLSMLLRYLDLAQRLPKENGLRLVHEIVRRGQLSARGRFEEGRAGLDEFLESLPRIPFFTERSRQHAAAGLLFVMGRAELRRFACGVLEYANRIDALGTRHHRLLAQYLRSAHHLYRGDMAAAQREEERLDDMATRLGSSWVPDLLSVVDCLPYHLSGDVVGLKRMVHRIERLLPIAPALALQRDVTRAMYEGHRGRPERALALYEQLSPRLPPFSDPCWAAARAHQAECLNALGRHGDAIGVCDAALLHVSNVRSYALVYHQLEREKAIALSGIGQHVEAAALLDALLAACAREGNALLNGLLHHDRARLACAAREPATFEQHAELSRIAFASTHNSLLISRARRLFELGRSAGLVSTRAEPETGLYDRSKHSLRVRSVLDEVADEVGAERAYLYLVLYGEAVLSAQVGALEPSTTLSAHVTAVARSLARQPSPDDTFIAESLAQIAEHVRSEGRIMPLLAEIDDTRVLVGFLVLGPCQKPEAIDTVDLARLALGLSERDEVTDLV